MGQQRKVFTYMSLIIAGILFFSLGLVFGGGNSSAQGKSSLKEARERLEQKLAEAPGFAGIAHLEAEGVIIVFLENEHAKGNIPDSFEGFTVRKQVTGRFKALGAQLMEAPTVSPVNQASYDRKGVVRPLVGGISVSALAGTRYIYAGTLGMVTYDNKILSNAHVIAMNPDNNAWLKKGTTIIQPGTLDLWNLGQLAKAADYKVGALQKYIPINWGSPRKANLADAAIASIDSTVTRSNGYELGADDGSAYQISGITPVGEGDTVRKSGRTSGVNSGTVIAANWAGWITYGKTDYAKLAYFRDQILVNGPFLLAGDSGSAVDKLVAGVPKFVGLGFAGSDAYGIVCKADNFVSALGISVGP